MTRRAPVRGGPARPRDARSPCGSTPALRGLPAGRCPPPGPTAQPSEWSSPTPSRRADRRSTQRWRCLLPRPVDTFGCVKTFGPRPPGPRLATMSSQPAQRHRGLVGRALADHGVRIVDTPTVRVHHPADLVGAVLSLIAIVLVLVLAVFAHRTTTGITQDVQGVAVVVRRVLFVPVAVLEGLVTFIAPIAELVMRRLVRQAFEAVAGGLLAVLTALLAAWLITELGVPDLRSAFSIWSREANLALVTIPALMSGTAGLLTAAGQRSRRRTVAWSWNLLWVALGIALITGAVTLPGALLTVLIGRTTGLGLRYAFGVRSERAYGPALVAGIRRAGFTPVRLIRVRDVASTHPSGDDALATDLAAVAITRYGDNRVYAMTTENGDRLDVVVLDGDRQVVGILTRFWRSMRLRGIDGRAVVSLRQAAERAALLCYAAWSAGVCTPRLLGLAESEDSMILIQQHARGAVPLRDLPPDDGTPAAAHRVPAGHSRGGSGQATRAERAARDAPRPPAEGGRRTGAAGPLRCPHGADRRRRHLRDVSDHHVAKLQRHPRRAGGGVAVVGAGVVRPRAADVPRLGAHGGRVRAGEAVALADHPGAGGGGVRRPGRPRRHRPRCDQPPPAHQAGGVQRPRGGLGGPGAAGPAGHDGG